MNFVKLARKKLIVLNHKEVHLTEFYVPIQIVELGFHTYLKPLQNKKGQKNLGYPRKKAVFFFGPSYFEAALDEIFSIDFFCSYQNERNLDFRLEHFISMNYFVPIIIVEVRFHVKESLFSKI